MLFITRILCTFWGHFLLRRKLETLQTWPEFEPTSERYVNKLTISLSRSNAKHVFQHISQIKLITSSSGECVR